MAPALMKIKMRETVIPDLLGIVPLPPDTVLWAGEVYEATQNPHGAIIAICANGEKVGVKPGEYELMTNNAEETVWQRR